MARLRASGHARAGRAFRERPGHRLLRLRPHGTLAAARQSHAADAARQSATRRPSADRADGRRDRVDRRSLGKPGERPLLSKEEIRENVHRMRDQAARFLEFGAGPTAALLLDNAKWLIEQRVIDFLRDVGKHFTVNIMLQKESVKARLESGLSFTEFSYMLLQAYDFLHLFRVAP